MPRSKPKKYEIDNGFLDSEEWAAFKVAAGEQLFYFLKKVDGIIKRIIDVWGIYEINSAKIVDYRMKRS